MYLNLSIPVHIRPTTWICGSGPPPKQIGEDHLQQIKGFLNRPPQKNRFNQIFHYKPPILGYPHFRKPLNNMWYIAFPMSFCTSTPSSAAPHSSLRTSHFGASPLNVLNGAHFGAPEVGSFGAQQHNWLEWTNMWYLMVIRISLLSLSLSPYIYID